MSGMGGWIGLDIASGDVWGWAGLAAFFAAVVLLWWFARTEAEGQVGRVEQEMRGRQRREQRPRKGQRVRGERLQRAILAGEVATTPPTPTPLEREGEREREGGRDMPQQADRAVYFPYGSWLPPTAWPRLVPTPGATPGATMVPREAEAPVVRVSGRRDVAAAAADTTPTRTPAPRMADPTRDSAQDDETYCPACLCVSLENHQAEGQAGWVFVPVGAVVTKGMLDESAVPHFCAHHCRQLVKLEVAGDLMGTNRRQGESVRGMVAYAARLIERVRVQRQDERWPDAHWRLGEDGTWQRDDRGEDRGEDRGGGGKVA